MSQADVHPAYNTKSRVEADKIKQRFLNDGSRVCGLNLKRQWGKTTTLAEKVLRILQQTKTDSPGVPVRVCMMAASSNTTDILCYTVCRVMQDVIVSASRRKCVVEVEDRRDEIYFVPAYDFDDMRGLVFDIIALDDVEYMSIKNDSDMYDPIVLYTYTDGDRLPDALQFKEGARQ